MNSKIIQGFFWVAFAAFLSASIPHVAYFFRAFEPIGQGQDTFWWVVSFFLAISIDVTIFLLSFTVASLHRQGKGKGLVFSVWVFIIGLAALSWFINWEYAQQFSSVMLAHVSGIRLGTIGTVGDVNPIIASAFQVLAIAYTWIADKIASTEPTKTAAQLKAEADELEAKATEQERIRTIKRTGKVSAFTGLIDGAKTVVTHARNATQNATQNATLPSDETQEENGQERNTKRNTKRNSITDVDATLLTGETQEENGQERNGKTVSITDVDATVKPDETQQKETGINQRDATKNTVSHRSTGARSVTIKETALLLNLSESYVRTLVKNGKLRTSPRNNKMVLMSSVKNYQNTLYNETERNGKTVPITEPITGKLSVVKTEPITDEIAV